MRHGDPEPIAQQQEHKSEEEKNLVRGTVLLGDRAERNANEGMSPRARSITDKVTKNPWR